MGRQEILILKDVFSYLISFKFVFLLRSLELTCENEECDTLDLGNYRTRNMAIMKCRLMSLVIPNISCSLGD